MPRLATVSMHAEHDLRFGVHKDEHQFQLQLLLQHVGVKFVDEELRQCAHNRPA